MAAAIVLFGALCTTSGFLLGAGRPPPWSALTAGPAATRVVGAILSAPAGWTVFALMAPVAAYYGWVGWNLLRADDGSRRERTTGLALLLGSVAGLLTSALVLRRMLQGQ